MAEALTCLQKFSNHGDGFDDFTISLRHDFIAFGLAIIVYCIRSTIAPELISSWTTVEVIISLVAN
jgi:hypothetical protein